MLSVLHLPATVNSVFVQHTWRITRILSFPGEIQSMTRLTLRSLTLLNSPSPQRRSPPALSLRQVCVRRFFWAIILSWNYYYFWNTIIVISHFWIESSGPCFRPSLTPCADGWWYIVLNNFMFLWIEVLTCISHYIFVE